MGRDVTFDDLVESGGGGSRTDPEPEAKPVPAEDDSAEWMFKTIQFLDERGYLGALIGADGADGPPARRIDETPAQPAEQPDEQPTDTDTDMSNQVDSETIAQALKQVYDLKGNISLKELIQMVENNPGMVDRLIESEL